jgi:sulfide:quinone oxidoreductase
VARVLVLGGGFGGIAAARELRRLLPAGHSVTLVDAKAHFRMGLRKLWDLDGRSGPEEGSRPLASLQGQGVDVLRGDIERIGVAPDASVTVGGARLPYDRLVVALGAETAPEALPGLREHAFDLYDRDGALRLRDALATWRGGRLAVLIASMPFKCPPAPYEAILLIDALLRKAGTREATTLTLATPEPHPLPVAPREYGERLLPFLKKAGVAYVPGFKATTVEAGAVAVEGGARLGFDLLAGVPPHRAPAVVRSSPLAGPNGWIPVEPRTFATKHADVWAVGDVAAAPLANGKMLPKAGVLAEGQARAAASAVAASLGVGEAKPFDGRGECFLELGDGVAMAARGDFYHQPEPRFDFEAPSAGGLERKVEFEASRLKAWFG